MTNFCGCSGLEEVLGVQLPKDLSTDEARDALAKLVSLPSQPLSAVVLQLCFSCAVPCRAVLCRSALRCAVPCHAVLCCVVLCCAVPLCAVLYRAMLCRAVPCRAVLCRAVLCRAVLCCAVLCCAVLCCAVLCCAVLCCAVLCCAVLCLQQGVPRAKMCCAVSREGCRVCAATDDSPAAGQASGGVPGGAACQPWLHLRPPPAHVPPCQGVSFVVPCPAAPCLMPLIVVWCAVK